ncbi:YihY/virulence factor BrkB family protein [Marivivens donghaensis]|uniref:YihY/virulence factor BrkB family protein n=1 Tax=Marivivens donghaensis TaxID=1699413 RepID=A0ABX0VTM6_9RHOB|nr:YihY/virulence factor BrkB family protein [Marivivens donghaensis]NIY71354.1 YihY/virulence factor BrkB family protein [Marivivens donghaensis]
MHLKKLAKELVEIYIESGLDMVAAGIAFYGMFSIFPAVAASIAIFGLIADPSVINDQLQLLHGVIPSDVFDIFQKQINSLLAAEDTALGWTTVVSVGLATWSARAGVASLIRGLNAIQGVPPRTGLWAILASIMLTVSLLAVALIALALVVVVPIVLNFIPYARQWGFTIALIRWGVALFVLLAALSILYRFGPNTTRRFRVGWLTPGAVLTVVFWLLASWGFSFYLANFGRYNEVYGSLGAVVAMLMWLYISSFLILLGAALNIAWLRSGIEELEVSKIGRRKKATSGT